MGDKSIIERPEQAKMKSTKKIVEDEVAQRTVSIGKRMALCFLWTIFGLVFFYLIMVFLSTISKNIVLDRLPTNGWARTASRHTASVTLFVFCLFMWSSPASLLSLFLAVMAACAQFCHFVIISSDLSVYVDKEIAYHIFKDEQNHPIFSQLPVFTAHIIGTIGFFAFLCISSERCFGSFLRYRKQRLPYSSLYSATWITCVYTLWFMDHFMKVVTAHVDKDLTHIAYPLMFLLPLWTSFAVMWKRVRQEKVKQIKIGRQKKSD